MFWYTVSKFFHSRLSNLKLSSLSLWDQFYYFELYTCSNSPFFFFSWVYLLLLETLLINGWGKKIPREQPSVLDTDYIDYILVLFYYIEYRLYSCVIHMHQCVCVCVCLFILVGCLSFFPNSMTKFTNIQLRIKPSSQTQVLSFRTTTQTITYLQYNIFDVFIDCAVFPKFTLSS